MGGEVIIADSGSCDRTVEIASQYPVIIAQIAPHSVHTHIKDERGVEPDYEFLIPGEGECDYVRYLKAMEKAGYDGHITVEISIMVQRRPDYDALAAADQSYRVVAKAFEEAGVARRHS